MPKPTPEPSKTAVILARVSSKEQAEGYSIDAQVDFLRDYCKKKNYTIFAEFADAETAKDVGRKQVKKLLQLIETGQITAVIVEKTDRIYRNIYDYADIMRMVESRKLPELHLVKEGEVMTADSSSSQWMMSIVRLAFADGFIRNLKEEVKKGQRTKARQGLWPSGAPLGYLNVQDEKLKRVIVPDPERAPLIEKLFSSYADGQVSMVNLAQFARIIGLTSRGGSRLAKSGIAWILNNPVYYGAIRWNGELMPDPGKHQPIISKATYDRCQDIMHGRLQNPAGFGVKEFTYRGMLTCGLCGCKLTAESKKGGKYIYYHCTGKRGKCEGQKSIQEPHITAQFMALLKGLVMPPHILARLKDLLRSDFETDHHFKSEQVKRLKKEEEKLSRQIEQIYLDKLAGEVSTQMYKDLKSRWESGLSEVRIGIGAFNAAELKHFDRAVYTLELAQQAHLLFAEATGPEKRKMLGFIGSNFSVIDGKLQCHLRRPYDVLLKAVQSEGENTGDGTLNENWQGVLDSVRSVAVAAA